MRKLILILSSSINLLGQGVIFFVIKKIFGDASLNLYALTISASLWLETVIAIGLPRFIRLSTNSQSLSKARLLSAISFILIITTLISCFIVFISSNVLNLFPSNEVSLWYAFGLGLTSACIRIIEALFDKFSKNFITICSSLLFSLSPVLSVYCSWIFGKPLSFALQLLIISRFAFIGLFFILLLSASARFNKRRSLFDFCREIGLLKASIFKIIRSLYALSSGIIKKSSSFFVGNFITSFYSFYFLAVIISRYQENIVSSYLISVKLLFSLLSLFATYFERHYATKLASLPINKQKLELSMFLCKFSRLAPSLAPFLLLIAVVIAKYSFTFFGEVNVLGIQALVLISTVSVVRCYALLIGVLNVVVLSSRFYLFTAFAYYGLSFLNLFLVKYLTVDFSYLLMLMLLVEVLFLTSNFIAIKTWLADRQLFCRSI